MGRDELTHALSAMTKLSDTLDALATQCLPTDVAQFMHPHPTIVEAIGEAHLGAAGKPLHGCWPD